MGNFKSQNKFYSWYVPKEENIFRKKYSIQDLELTDFSDINCLRIMEACFEISGPIEESTIWSTKQKNFFLKKSSLKQWKSSTGIQFGFKSVKLKNLMIRLVVSLFNQVVLSEKIERKLNFLLREGLFLSYNCLRAQAKYIIAANAVINKKGG